MPKLAPVRFLRQRPFGFEYFRAVPKDIVPIIGRQRWYARIHATSREEATRQVRALASQHDDLIVRARKDPEGFQQAQAALDYYDATPETIADKANDSAEGMAEYRSRLMWQLESNVEKSGMAFKPAMDIVRAGETVFAKGNAEARETARDAVDAVRRAEGKGSASRAFSKLVDAWADRRQIRPRSKAEAVRAIRMFVDTTGVTEVGAINRDHMRKFQEACLTGRSRASAVKLWTMFGNAVIGQGIADGLIDLDPRGAMTIASRKADSKREAFTDDEVRKIIEAAEGNRDRELLLTLVYTGMRLGEACGVEPADYEPGGFFNIRPNASRPLKTASSVRLVPIHPDLAEALGDWRPAPNDPLPASKRLNRLIRSIGLTKPVHSLRHSSVERMRSQGVHPSIARRIHGHAAPDAHEGYGGVTREALSEVMKKVQFPT